MISKFNVGLKTLLREGLSEPLFYGDLVYNLRNLQEGFFSIRKKKTLRVTDVYIGYNLNDM